MKAIHEAGLCISEYVAGIDNIPDAAYTHSALTIAEQSVDNVACGCDDID